MKKLKCYLHLKSYFPWKIVEKEKDECWYDSLLWKSQNSKVAEITLHLQTIASIRQTFWPQF